MNNKEIMDYAEEAIIHTYNRFPVVLDHGDGVYLYDVEGKKYLDFAAGIAVCAFGYNVKEYNDAPEGSDRQNDPCVQFVLYTAYGRSGTQAGECLRP